MKLVQCKQITKEMQCRQTVKFVESAKMFEKRFERLGHRRQFKEAVDDDVKHRQKAKTDVAKVDGEVLRLLGDVRRLKVVLLRVFLQKGMKFN